MQKQRIGNKASVFGQAARVDRGSTCERTSSLMDREEGRREGARSQDSPSSLFLESRSLLWSWKKLMQTDCLSVEKSKLRKSQSHGNKRLIIIYSCFSHRAIFFQNCLFSLSLSLFLFVCFAWGSPCRTPSQSSWLEPLENIVLMSSVESTPQGRQAPCPGRQVCPHPFPPLWSTLVIPRFLCRLF